MDQIEIQVIDKLFTVTHQVAPGAKSAILELPCYCSVLIDHAYSLICYHSIVLVICNPIPFIWIRQHGQIDNTDNFT